MQISNCKRQKSEPAGNCEVKRHVLEAIQRAAIPGSTKQTRPGSIPSAAEAT